jgi:16S rRNA G1207 methylase RsmC
VTQPHYFTGSPAPDAERRLISVTLAGATVDVEVASGVFSPGRLDPGTAVLLRTVPPPPESGNLLDLGCGWGPLALTLALSAPDATVWAVDASERALDLMARNAARLGLTNIRAALPADVPADVRFEGLWSNPPIRIGKSALHEMLRHWLPRVLPEHGAWLVVAKQLGADSLARWIADDLGARVERSTSDKGFRVLHVS